MNTTAAAEASTSDDFWVCLLAYRRLGEAAALLEACQVEVGGLVTATAWSSRGMRALRAALAELAAQTASELERLRDEQRRVLAVGV